eukprot:8347779-Pyramimonas_sp.AAC.1
MDMADGRELRGPRKGRAEFRFILSGDGDECQADVALPRLAAARGMAAHPGGDEDSRSQG